MEDSWVPVHWIMEDNGVPVGFLSELNLLLQFRRHVLKIIFQPIILCSIRFSIYVALFFICKFCSFDLCSDTVAVFSFPSENSSSSSVLAPIVIFTSAGVRLLVPFFSSYWLLLLQVHLLPLLLLCLHLTGSLRTNQRYVLIAKLLLPLE